MLQSLKQKSLKSRIPILLILGVAAIALIVVVAPFLLGLITGPKAFDPYEVDDVTNLKGMYVEADLDTLVDYYAETVESQEYHKDKTVAREYILPIYTEDEVYYVGVEVKADKIDDAEAVLNDTIRMLDDEDGSYEWDGSLLSVRGTFCEMDSETKGLYQDYLDYLELDAEDEARFLPLVLKDKNIGGLYASAMVPLGIALVVVLICFVYILVRALTGGYQKQIKAYISKSMDPEGTEHALDLFYEDTPVEDKHLRMDRSWLLYDDNTQPFLLAGRDIAWAYQNLTRQKMYGIITVSKSYSVHICSVSEDRRDREHVIPVRNEAAAQELLGKLNRLYPDAAYGYTPEIAREYNEDPAAFQRKVQAARRAEGETAAATAE